MLLDGVFTGLAMHLCRCYNGLITSVYTGYTAHLRQLRPAMTSTAHPFSMYRSVLQLLATPQREDQTDLSIFSDLGSWLGYSLPDSKASRGGFSGPYLLSEDRWLGECLAMIRPQINGASFDFSSAEGEVSSYPGSLFQEWRSRDIELTVELIFLSARCSLTLARLRNIGDTSVEVRVDWEGQAFTHPNFSISSQYQIEFTSGKAKIVQRYSEAVVMTPVGTNGFYAQGQNIIQLAPGLSLESSITQSIDFDGVPSSNKSITLTDPSVAIEANRARWTEYLSPIDRQELSSDERRLGAKAIETLISNWRSALGGLKHDGCFPSYITFRGFWPWDSWKHAVALATIEPQLAKEQIRAVFDYQDEAGILSDTIELDTTKNNTRNTKPPLAAWAVWHVYQATSDQAFLDELYPKLVKYHEWWYKFRDHHNDGLCQFGCTDGTHTAAAWESGMDNAVRFDGAEIIPNGDRAFSLSQYSVDLNCYLALEKRCLARLARAIGLDSEQARWKSESSALETRIREFFFDDTDGYFHDRRFDGSMVEAAGCEGWTPLWTGIASPDQAAQVRNVMMDPKRFFTYMPLPSLDAGNPKFAPDLGYWRGPVWLDQVYFGIRGLERYGFVDDAKRIKDAMFFHGDGLLGDKPIMETYNPITGKGNNAKHFSWSAAHILMLLMGRPSEEA